MATKLHSAVAAGSRHPIHQLEYPDAANRAAGTGETTGATPKDFDVALQTDDNSLWFLKDAGTLDWDQILTGGTSVTFEDDKDLLFGDAGDAAIQYDTTQTPDSWLFGVPATSNALILCLKANMGGDYAHGLQTDPTLFIHSATAAGGATDEWISFTHDQTYGRISTGTGPLAIGAEVTSHSLDIDGDLVVRKLEVNNSSFFDSSSQYAAGSFSYSETSIGAVQYRNATQTVDCPILATGSTGNYWLLCEYGDIGFDFQHAQQTNPTFIIHSANQATDEWISATHNQTDAVIGSGKGGLEIDADWIRTASSKWYHYRQLSAFSIDPGGSGATLTAPTANTLGGYQLDAATEYLYFSTDIHDDWDGASDIKVEVYWETNAAGGAGSDSVDLQLLCYIKGQSDTACKTQTLEEAVTVGTAAQYTAFKTEFLIDYDSGTDPVDSGDLISMRLNLETDTSEVDDIFVNHIDIYYQTKQVNIEI